ncbi:hypothetical protein ACWEFL_34525 [Streptomyces sp. NPDC004838]
MRPEDTNTEVRRPRPGRGRVGALPRSLTLASCVALVSLAAPLSPAVAADPVKTPGTMSLCVNRGAEAGASAGAGAGTDAGAEAGTGGGVQTGAETNAGGGVDTGTGGGVGAGTAGGPFAPRPARAERPIPYDRGGFAAIYDAGASPGEFARAVHNGVLGLPAVAELRAGLNDADGLLDPASPKLHTGQLYEIAGAACVRVPVDTSRTYYVLSYRKEYDPSGNFIGFRDFQRPGAGPQWPLGYWADIGDSAGSPTDGPGPTDRPGPAVRPGPVNRPGPVGIAPPPDDARLPDGPDRTGGPGPYGGRGPHGRQGPDGESPQVAATEAPFTVKITGRAGAPGPGEIRPVLPPTPR